MYRLNDFFLLSKNKQFVVSAFGKFWVPIHFGICRMQTILAALAERTFLKTLNDARTLGHSLVQPIKIRGSLESDSWALHSVIIN